MKSVRLWAAGDLRVETIDPPGPIGPDEVRIKVLAAGICGSDLHNFRTGQWISRSPSVAGHEFTGILVELGASVSGLAIGDHVVADSRYWCGHCAACRAGRHNVCENMGFVGEVCDGGFAADCVLPARLVVPISADVEPYMAAMAEPLAVALHAIRRLAPDLGAAVLIAGCGPIGALSAVLLAHLHDGPVLVADRNIERRDLVCEIAGAFDVDLEAASIATALDGQPLLYALDATGNIGVCETLMELLSPGGSLAFVGIGHGTIPLDPTRLVEREIALIGCHAYRKELPEVTALLPSLQSRLRCLIDNVIGLDDVPAAYDYLLAARARGIKVIIDPDLPACGPCAGK